MAGRQQSERRQKTQNVPSQLLSNTENEQIFNIIGNKCVHKSLDWQQELYSQFKYKEPRDQFHTFEADTCSAGLSFANAAEAKEFAQVINSKLRERVERRRTKRRQTQHGLSNAHQPMSISGPQSSLPATPAPAPPVITPAKGGKNKSKVTKAKKITKEDISKPSDFRHVNHVGWDPNSGFDINNLNPDMKSLFEMAGISNEVLADDDMRKQIYEVIEKQGGFDAIKMQVGQRGPPPAPSHAGSRAAGSRDLPPPPPRHSSAAAPPPPPPTRDIPSVSVAAPPPPPNRNRNRTPAPSVAPPPPPPAGRASHRQTSGPPPPPAVGVPAPPPPPPPPPSGGPPPPPGGMPPPPPPSAAPAGMPVAAGMGGRGALLNDIQSGRKLREVSGQASPAPPPPATGRDALLDQIKRGRELKHFDTSKADNSPPPSEADAEGGGNLLNALMNVMKSRNQAINPSDESSEGEDDDDDWDDDD